MNLMTEDGEKQVYDALRVIGRGLGGIKFSALCDLCNERYGRHPKHYWKKYLEQLTDMGYAVKIGTHSYYTVWEACDPWADEDAA